MKAIIIGSDKLNGKAQKDNNEKGGVENVNKEIKANQSDSFKPDGKPTPTAETPKTEETKAEPTKKEIKAKLTEEKPPMNLEQMLKKIKDLTRLSNQRDKLSSTIDTLDSFEVAQMDDAEETNINHFQGCTLTITDDQDREFTTKNPFIIKHTADNIKSLCLEKLGEVEGQINSTY